MIKVSNNLVIPDSELSWRFTTSGGPGGQHANRSSTRVEVTFIFADSQVLTPTQLKSLQKKYGDRLHITVDATRSQHRNRELALDRLVKKLQEAFVTQKTRRSTKPSKRSVQRRLDRKKRRSQQIADRRVQD